MQSKVIRSLDEMGIWADFFVENLIKGLDKALIIGLSGELGSGKTAFVQSVAKVFKIKNYITSPTFVIQKRYKINLPTGRQVVESGFENLIHIDAYRLESGDELLNLGWGEIVKNPKNIIFIEWPERVNEVLDKDMKMIHFKFIDEKTREVIFD